MNMYKNGNKTKKTLLTKMKEKSKYLVILYRKKIYVHSYRFTEVYK